MNQLNTEQRTAIQYIDGPLLVLAGAGSGKTRVITQKIAHLVQNCAQPARHIAAITFTNKAAREMQERIASVLPSPANRGLTVSTFHSLGMMLLRADAKHLGYKPQFSILDSADSLKILADLLKNVDKQVLREVQTRISRWKNALISPNDALIAADDEVSLHAAKMYREYQATLSAYQAMDFDDLIGLPVRLFDENPEVLARWQHKFRYLLVDEYQDTNDCQYQMLKRLAGVRGAFTAVGDDDQSIYAWRGANIENLHQLPRDYPQLKIIALEQNYRSTTRILRAANQVIANNPKVFEKKLWSEHGLGDPIYLLAAKDEEHEAESIVMRLMAHKFAHNAKYSDYAILYRSNHQARLFESHLRNQKAPYQISGGTSFFDRAEIKDIIAYLRLLANADDDPAFIRAITTPKRGIGTATLEKLGQYAAKREISLFAALFETGFQGVLNPAQHEALAIFGNFINNMAYRAEREDCAPVLHDLVKNIAYENWLFDNEDPKPAENKWKNVLDFMAWMGEKGEKNSKTLIAMTQTIALMTMLEGKDDGEIDAIRLSTLHAAKGLEFGHVFLVGVEEEILPHMQSMDSPEGIEEERRLMYVGITRAQRSLTISYACKRRRGGDYKTTEPSRFIAELPAEDIKHAGVSKDAAASTDKADAKHYLAQMRAMLADDGSEDSRDRQ